MKFLSVICCNFTGLINKKVNIKINDEKWLTWTWIRTSENPEAWLDEQHKAFNPPSQSAVSGAQRAVNSAQRTAISFNLN